MLKELIEEWRTLVFMASLVELVFGFLFWFHFQIRYQQIITSLKSGKRRSMWWLWWGIFLLWPMELFRFWTNRFDNYTIQLAKRGISKSPKHKLKELLLLRHTH
jgi:hypothetical protein